MTLYVGDDGVLVSRQVGEFYTRAEQGLKPNVVAMVDPDTDRRLRDARPRIRFIRVVDPKGGREFHAQVTDMTSIGTLAGGTLWVVSFRVE